MGIIGVGFLCMLGLEGCSAGESKAGLEPNDASASFLVVSAPTATVDVGESIRIHASGRTEAGQAVPVSVTWSSTGGTLVPVSDSEALFSSAAAGAFIVRAESHSAPYPVDSMIVTVALPSSPTVSLTLSPAEISLSAGGTFQFSAIATRADGSTYLPTLTWLATGGTVTAGGLYTAGTAAGSYRVIATQQGGSLADTSAVSVSGSAGGPSEPVPMGTIFFDGRAGGAQSFQSVNTLGEVAGLFAASGGGIDGESNAKFAFTTDYNGAGKHALRIDWNAQPGGESEVSMLYYYPAIYSRVYASVVIHLGRTTTGGGNGAVGSFIPVTNAGGMKRFMWLRQRDQGTDRTYWVWPTGGQPSGNNLSIDNLDLDVPFTANYGIGQDVRWTFELIAGNPSTTRVWRNGVLVLNNTNAGIGARGFAESILATTRFATQQAESEYWTDLVLWTTP